MNDTLAQRVWQQGLSLLKGTDEATLWKVLNELRGHWVLSGLERHTMVQKCARLIVPSVVSVQLWYS